MFLGSIPDSARRILHRIVDSWNRTNIAVGCSGNFVIERMMVPMGFPLHGNDVTMYSCALGRYFAGQNLGIEPRDDLGDLDWIVQYSHHPIDLLADIMLCTNFLNAFDSHLKLKPARYWSRTIEGYKMQWERLHVETVEKLSRVVMDLESFHAGDAVDWVKDLPSDYAVISYPPFYKGGYEVMFGKLDAFFKWDEPIYPIMDNDIRMGYIDSIADRENWVFGIDFEHEGYSEYFCGYTQPSNRSVPIYVYSSAGKVVNQIALPEQGLEDVKVTKFVKGDEMGDKLTLYPLTAKQFNALRSQYLDGKIAPASVGLPLAVLCDGKLIGAFAYSMSSSFGDASTVYLLSDFAVSFTDYARLSKLVLYAALSSEGKMLAERMSNRRIRNAFTTAFSQNPVSMKYRGLFKLYSRKETPDDPQYTYMLNYISQMGRWTLDEGLKEWKRKHAKKVRS